MPSETTVRDELALERTLLANERTLLAYVRTALALCGAGVGGALVVDSPASRWLAGAGIAISVATAVIGVFRFRTVRADLRRARAEIAPRAPVHPSSDPREDPVR